ncbi:DUF1028 domain-containing protein [Rhizohabitans arisaemae]|uniref:DUF1028 domain-containing protein n=1 Tax=Rhizohabitans arisaemae TaxID=2720610 RepID=UPI0024B1783A|nr:DUF1028 domain-containing protein [Rhizohabitans arisaemae]
MTYSIVARDGVTGEIGVAVASHAFAVGRDVAFARAGVGAVATQGTPDPGHAERLLDALEAGATAAQALHALVADDSARRIRQTALIGSRAAPAAHTGSFCVPFASHAVAGDHSCQGNLLTSDGAWDAMAEAYRTATGSFEERLIGALEAGLRHGGDLRGQQAAAVLIVGPRPGTRPRIDFRVDDHPTPTAELRRLIAMDRADRRLRDALGVVLGAPGDPRDTLESLARAQEVFGSANREPDFWAAVIVERLDELDRFPPDPRWRELRARLSRLRSPRTRP